MGRFFFRGNTLWDIMTFGIIVCITALAMSSTAAGHPMHMGVLDMTILSLFLLRISIPGVISLASAAAAKSDISLYGAVFPGLAGIAAIGVVSSMEAYTLFAMGIVLATFLWIVNRWARLLRSGVWTSLWLCTSGFMAGFAAWAFSYDGYAMRMFSASLPDSWPLLGTLALLLAEFCIAWHLDNETAFKNAKIH